MTKKILITKSKVELMGIKNLLDSEGIENFEINNVDPGFAGVFGDYELKVNEKDFEKAREIIKQFQSE
ncbi:putative signal transducing protein [Psychroflexus montanilacus]|uniref:putative signal transducing protein n=1 Tax=Psychroflexus montanilacus TaxID=2873598 RepID=UPI001CD02E21|nr:DUF2007 domain-containing protein [Psychroflexus montanilacus]MBZ9651579.1 DUF2007 domain-containing protein [Psychroflexus montanilacus]